MNLSRQPSTFRVVDYVNAPVPRAGCQPVKGFLSDDNDDERPGFSGSVSSDPFIRSPTGRFGRRHDKKRLKGNLPA